MKRLALKFEARFDPAAKRYSGGLGYTDGTIHFQNLNPMVHSLEAEFDATPDSFTLKRSTLKTGASQFALSATVKGGDGNDLLGLALLTAKPPAVSLLDGGAGFDTAVATANVTVTNVP